MSIAFLLMGNIMASQVPKGEIKIEAAAVHPLWRSHAYPSNHEVDVNPPVFIWPSSRINFTEPLLEYDFELAKEQDFNSKTISIKKQNPSFYVSELPLSKGKWFWRYRQSGKDWKGPFTFSISKNTRIDKRPSAREFVDAVQGSRPRMVIRQQNLNSLQEKFKQSGELKSLL